MPHNIDAVLLVGAGPMAVDYARVLKDQNIAFNVVGRSYTSAEQFKKQIEGDVITGGLKEYLKSYSGPNAAIVCTGVEALEENTITLLEAGCKKILIEKPGALTADGIENINLLSVKNNASVHIGYNRRFYASVEKARQIIAEDGGLREIYFEFTEWGHVIGPLHKAPGVKEHWLLANSTHVIDLAFYMAGLPGDWNSWTSGSSDWHPAAMQFVGAGVTNKNILFTYQADWEGPGRWGIELVTEKRRLYLKPLEQLFQQQRGSLAVEQVHLADERDKLHKPGLYTQVEKWLQNQDEELCSIQEQMDAIKYYYQMAGYEE